MTAPNHALTGALIGLSIANPLLALPLALLSHFVLDAIPHHDPPLTISHRRYTHKLFIEAGLCGLVVLALVLTRPHHWLLAALGAFLATSPDLLWFTKYLKKEEMVPVKATDNWFWRFHGWVQWKTGPSLFPVEILWFVAAGSLFMSQL